jgi:3-oxoacyl-[acyl-carrier protein] reductase
MNNIDLEGRVAVVTGGAQGIGRAVAERFVQSGARVMIWDRDHSATSECENSLGANVMALDADVSDYQAVEAATRQTLDALGKIDILVNSAGIAGPIATTWEYPLDEWQRVMDINLNGSFYCVKALVPHMLRSGYGRIVLIASVAGKEGNPNASAYSASKAAVIGLTKSLGKELSDQNIAVNCITPAAARTRIFEQISEEHIAYMLSKIPRGRFLETNEVASMVAWLCSEENSFTTAAVFDLSGGRATY